MFRIGEIVRKIDDYSDEGVVIAQWGWTTRIKWIKRGYKEDIRPDHLEICKQGE